MGLGMAADLSATFVQGLGNKVVGARIVNRRSGPGLRMVLSMTGRHGSVIVATVPKIFQSVDQALQAASDEYRLDQSSVKVTPSINMDTGVASSGEYLS